MSSYMWRTVDADHGGQDADPHSDDHRHKNLGLADHPIIMYPIKQTIHQIWSLNTD